MVAEQPVVCSPLSVVVNGAGKRRLVVNLRHVNHYLKVQKFKYEDLRVAMLLFKPGEWMFAFDLKSGYHHVDIVEHHQKFLGFRWKSRFLCIYCIAIWVVYCTISIYKVAASSSTVVAR